MDPDALGRGPLRSSYLLHGEETFLIERALRVLRDRLAPPERTGGWRTLWGDHDGPRLAAALADLTSPLLFGGVDVLVVRHAEALDEEAQERIAAVMPRLGERAHLILVARIVDFRRRLFAAYQREGSAFGFSPSGDRRVTRDWVIRIAREAGREIVSAAVDELLERTGPDLGVIAGEIEKISLTMDAGRRIDPAHVRAMVAHVRAHGVEELTDRIAHRDVAGAARALRALLAEGEPPVRTVAFLAANLRRALHVAELSEAGAGPEVIAQRLGMPGWMVARNLGRGSAEGLARALVALREVDRDLKSSRQSEARFEAAVLAIAAGG